MVGIAREHGGQELPGRGLVAQAELRLRLQEQRRGFLPICRSSSKSSIVGSDVAK